MKHLIKFGFICGMTFSSSVFCLDPVQGLYLGVQAGISHGSPNPPVNFTYLGNTYSSTATLGPAGGGGGFSLGYRMNNVRVEGEFLFNINSYGQLTLGSCTLLSPSVVGPRGTCPNTFTGIGFNGNTVGLYGMFNVFYDFMSSDTTKTFFPYIGLGLGGAIIKNTAKFGPSEGSTATPVFFNVTSSKGGLAGQGILGFGYYLDDFATLGLDFRYTSTFSTNSNKTSTSTSSTSKTNSQFAIATINLTATFALEKTKD